MRDETRDNLREDGLRVGFVSGEYPPHRGGVGDYTRLLARHLAARGLQVQILTHRAARANADALRVHALIGRWGWNALLTARRWADNLRLDLVHLQFQTAAFSMSPWVHFLPRATRQPTLTTFHDVRAPYLFPGAGRLRGASVRFLARHSSGVIVTGPGDRAALPDHSRIREIPVGSNILASLPADYNRSGTRERYGADSGDFVLAHFGFAHESKGLADLLAALAELRGSGVPARLWFIGALRGDSDPQNRAAQTNLEAQVKTLGLAPFIHKSGYLEEAQVRAALSAADVVVLPYRDGAAYHHGSLQAAIHAGCAIISTIPQSPAPLFQDSTNLRLVPATDVPALTATCQELYRHSNQRESLRAGARALAAKFSWERIAARHEAFYREVLESAR